MASRAPAKPIPAWVVTGPLGCGKTTLIAQWLASKEPSENWVVLLNEYSDAGIDALTVAAAARGAYDVRLVPGGCLCCAGEADFRRNLGELVEQVHPAGILVEPSGIGHPGGIVEELLAHEAAGGIQLRGVIGLIDPAHVSSTDENVIAVREIADALVLSKADVASAAERENFWSSARGLFPEKSWIDEMQGGRLPPVLLETVTTGASLRAAARLRPAAHQSEREHAHDESPLVMLERGAERREFHHLGRHGARWIFPRALAFSETRLLSLLSSDLALVDAGLCRPERFKAVLRVDEEQWLLVQTHGGRVSMQTTAWRRDHRLEVQLPVGARWDAAAWDRLWTRCLQA